MSCRQFRRRKCRYCRKLFSPHPAIGNRQICCASDACKRAKKAADNRRFARRNPDYHRGPVAVKRVRAWRRENSGYWKRPRRRSSDASLSQAPLQAELTPERLELDMVTAQERVDALQEELVAQFTLIQGLAAHLTGCALSAELFPVLSRWHDKGKALGAAQGVHSLLFTSTLSKEQDNAKLTITPSGTTTTRAGPL